MEPRIELDMPMKFGAEARIVLRLRDKALVGSRNHFVRFDLYTTYAPSHPERHLGYWDIALHTIKQDANRVPVSGRADATRRIFLEQWIP